MKQSKAKKSPTPLPSSPRRSFRQWLTENRSTLIALLVCAVVFVVAFAYTHHDPDRIHEAQAEHSYAYERAQVLAVTKDTVSVDRYTTDAREIGTQTLLLRLLTGDRKGENVETNNYVSLFSSQKLKEGDKLIVIQEPQEDGSVALTVYMYDRIPAVIFVVLLFFVITTVVGGKTGLKSLLGLALTVVCIIYILCPMLMLGWAVVPATFLICVYVAVCSFVILGGIRRKTVCAMLSTVAGMALAGLFGFLAQKLTRVDSYALYDTSGSMLEALQQIQLQDIPLHLTGLLTGGILISSLGAVMDVAMSLASSMQELKAVNPDMSRKDLWRSGMNIGRDMVGTMTNTLILAFVGSSLVMILYLWALNPDSYQLLASRFFSVEVISGVSSSVGVVLCVPLSCLIGSIFFGSKKDN